MNEIVGDSKAEPNGIAYRHCIGWKQVAGCGEGCFGMCTEAQRKACNETQQDDRLKRKVNDI